MTTKGKRPKSRKAKGRESSRTTRPTTLSLAPEHWSRLLEIEEDTGARPSVTVRRILDAAWGVTQS